MVSQSVVQHSNSLISNSLSSPVTALFVGGTSGVGRITLLKLAKFAKCPRIYLVGRSQAAADEIIAECRTLNPQGHYTFVQADVSLVAGVDRFCETFKGLESTLDLLFLSPGVLSMDRSGMSWSEYSREAHQSYRVVELVTSENIHLLAAVNYYCRMRIITSLLPLVQRSSLRRVVTVAGGGNEGPLDLDDLQGLRVPIPQLRGHLSTLITLGLEAVAIKAPSVSFIHSYPGSVVTGLYRDLEKPPFDLASAVSIDECGERQLYVATNARFAPKELHSVGVSMEGADVTVGSNREPNSGVYTVGKDCESASKQVLDSLADLREHGAVQRIWQHTMDLFREVLEAPTIKKQG